MPAARVAGTWHRDKTRGAHSTEGRPRRWVDRGRGWGGQGGRRRVGGRRRARDWPRHLWVALCPGLLGSPTPALHALLPAPPPPSSQSLAFRDNPPTHPLGICVGPADTCVVAGEVSKDRDHDGLSPEPSSCNRSHWWSEGCVLGTILESSLGDLLKSRGPTGSCTSQGSPGSNRKSH